jgi:hypothetical protein
MTAAQAKTKKRRHSTVVNDKPSEGSRIREIYDLLMASKGRVVLIDLTHSGDDRRLASLQDFYGLDIRIVRRGRRRAGRSTEIVLAGEWFGRVYIDYIAEHLNSVPSQGEAPAVSPSAPQPCVAAGAANTARMS